MDKRDMMSSYHEYDDVDESMIKFAGSRDYPRRRAEHHNLMDIALKVVEHEFFKLDRGKNRKLFKGYERVVFDLRKKISEGQHFDYHDNDYQ